MKNNDYDLAQQLLASLSKRRRRMLVSQFVDWDSSDITIAESPDRILRRGEVAVRLSKCTRVVDRLAARGVLHRVTFPGSIKACGFRESEVVALIAGRS